MQQDAVFHSRAVPMGGALDDDPEPMVQQQLARMYFLREAAGWAGKSVLDFGSGSGFNAQLLGDARSYLGFDLLPAAVSLAQRLNPGVRFQIGDGCATNLALGQFERVISCEVLEHVPDREQMVRNIQRHLTSDGLAFITTPNVKVFSNGHRPSPMNREHVRELDLEEFLAVMRPFSEVTVYGQRFRRPELCAAWSEDVEAKQAALAAGTRWREPKTHSGLLRAIHAVPPVGWAWRTARYRIAPALTRRHARKQRPYGWQDFEFTREPQDVDASLWFCALCRA